MFGAAVANGTSIHIVTIGALVTYVNHIEPFNLQTLPTGCIFSPG